jgi:2-polyprenyl-6-methoxyphenol hydroxylase-like FAD-dependent oxidoreductase
MAGLVAARVLSERFERVTIIERDKLPDGAEFRGGVPQARHAHALLAQGQRILEALFPDLQTNFAEVGAPRMVWGIDTATFTAGGWAKRFDTGITTNVITRVALEWYARRHLQKLPNVHFVEEAEVERLLTTPDKTRVTGVEFRTRRVQTAQTLTADLIVDTSGRKSKAPEWLQTLGYDAPEETHVNSYLGYATRWYEAQPGHDWTVIAVQAWQTAAGIRGGGIFKVEGNRWLVTLAGMNKDYPPTDPDGFLEFARSFATATVYEAIKDAKPLSPVYGYRYDGSRIRHYERLTRRPENFIVMGDAACSFNPIYGQGMTVAALEALELKQLLEQYAGRDLSGFAGKFQRRLSKATQNAWLMATGEDLRFPGTEGDRPNALARFIQRYMDRLVLTLPYDETVTLAFLEAMNLTRSPAALLAPRIALRVLWHSLFSKPTGDSANAPKQMPLEQVSAAGD